MSELRDLLETYVDNGTVPGAVALVARGDRSEVAAVGCAEIDGPTPMARDAIFRIASITKPIVAAAVLMLVEDGRIALDEPVGAWLPELAHPTVVRTPEGPVDDVVPAVRPITVEDLLTFRAGYGFPADFTLPAVGLLFKEVQRDPRNPRSFPPQDEWMAKLAAIPMLHQPGEAWLYNTCSDLLGVLIARASGQPLPEFLAERVFEPLGMTDTGFEVPEAKRDRFTSYYQAADQGFELLDGPDGWFNGLPAFASGGGGLVSTLDDYHAFARMLLDGGKGLLSPESVRQMTTDHLTQAQREAADLFLEGQGWGYGGAVKEGRYGWVGGTGTTAHITPSTGTVTILLTQLAMTGPATTPLMRDFWRYADRP